MTQHVHGQGPAAGFALRHLPILGWLPGYPKKWLAADALAAFSVWALLVPQSLGYSSIAGVPLQYGLYTAFAALIAYAILGTSKQACQGPSASVAAVSAATVAPLVGAKFGTADAVPMTAALALTAGVIYLILAVARMGWIANFLSRAVMSGFVLGFSIGIIFDQSAKLIGVPKTDGSYWQQLVGTIKHIPDTNLYTLALSMTALVILLLMRYFLPKWPRAIIVVVLSIIAVTAFDLTAKGVAVTGTVPTGMFTVGVPQGVWDNLPAIIAGALAVIFVGYSETLATGSAMATKHGYEIDPNQELAAEGVSFVAAGLVGGFVTDASLSKTSVADAAGQKSQMASLMNAVLVLLTFLFLASLFKNLPAGVLAAVVIDAMIGLIHFGPMIRYYRVNRADFVFFMAAGLGIIFFSITQGILIGVVLSLLVLIARASKPALNRLGKDPDSGQYLTIAYHQGLTEQPGVLVVRLDGPLFFANAKRFQDGVNQLISTSETPVHAVVADMESVMHSDTDAADTLIAMGTHLRAKGVWFAIAHITPENRDLWDKAGVLDTIGADHVFDLVPDAVQAAAASITPTAPHTSSAPRS